MVDAGVGISEAYFTWHSIASSVSSLKKSAFQYHWRPGGKVESNMLCNAGCGIGPTRSRAGVRKPRIGLKVSSALSNGPVQHQMIPHIFLLWRCCGKGGPAGTTKKAKNPLTSSGACVMYSRYHFITRGAWLS